MTNVKPSGADEQLELARRAQAGDRAALAELVDSQHGLVRRIAASYAQGAGHVELDDLIQEGYVALLRAARHFDPKRGYAFTTYVGDCIRRRLIRWLKLRRVAKLGAQELRRESNAGNPLANVPDRLPPPSAQQIAELLKSLPPLDRAIVCKRHGLDYRHAAVPDIRKLLGISLKEERRRYQAACAEILRRDE